MDNKTIKMVGNALKIGNSSLHVINSMKVENQEITLTNLDTTITIKTDCQGNGLINFEHFKKTLDIENSEKIDMDMSDYPETPESKYSGQNCLTNYLNTKLFNQSYKNYLPFCHKDETRPVLKNVYIGPDYTVATDGHKLIIDRENTSKTPFYITEDVSKLLDIVLKTDTVQSAYTFEDKYLKINTQNYEITSRIDFGDYPNVEMVIPKENQQYIELSIDQIEVLKKSIEILLPYTNTKTNLMIFKNNTLYVNNKDRNIAVQIVLPFNVTPYIETIYQTASIKDISVFNALEIGINGQYFLNNLKQLKTAVKIGYRTTISPVTFETENSIDLLLMPLRILKGHSFNYVNDNLEYITHDYKNLELPVIKPAKKPAQKVKLSGYYLFNVQSLYGITKDINMPNIVKELTITEYKAFQKLNVSKLTTLTV